MVLNFDLFSFAVFQISESVKFSSRDSGVLFMSRDGRRISGVTVLPSRPVSSHSRAEISDHISFSIILFTYKQNMQQAKHCKFERDRIPTASDTALESYSHMIKLEPML